jgi:hypothetical protein
VIFTALLLEQFAPASTVTDELGLAEADALPVLPDEAVLDEPAAPGAEELLPLLHAARPAAAAMAAIPPSASLDLLLVVLVLSLFIGRTPLFPYLSGARAVRAGAHEGAKRGVDRRREPQRP